MPQRSILDNAFKLNTDVDKRGYEPDSEHDRQGPLRATSLAVTQNSPPNNDCQSKEGRNRGFLQQVIVVSILVKRQNSEINQSDSQNKARSLIVCIQKLPGKDPIKAAFQQPE